MIGSSENRISYNGNGIATEFAYNFIIIEKSDIKVLHVAADGTEQLLTKDYYVDMEKSVVLYPGYAPGAEIPEQNRPPVLPVGERLVIYREVPITQDSALDKHWPFNVIENGLDKLTIICQQIWDRLQRSFYVSESTSTNFDPKVPIEAGKTFRVKDDGTGFEVTEDPGKVIDGATALLEQTTEQANIAVESSTSAQNAANAAEAVAPEYAKTKEVLDNIVSYTNTATEQASIATAKAEAANTSETNAAQSYANADAIATQLTEYLATKETLTAPAVDKTLLIEGAAAEAKSVGELKSDLVKLETIEDIVDDVSNVWINKYSHEEAEASNYITTGYIPIQNGKTYYLTAKRQPNNSYDTSLNVYNSDKTFYKYYISDFDNTEFVAPIDGYIRLTMFDNGIPICKTKDIFVIENMDTLEGKVDVLEGKVDVLENKVNTLENKTIIWFGTSIPSGQKSVIDVGGMNVQNNYPSMVAKILNCNVINQAIGTSTARTGITSRITDDDPMGVHGVQYQIGTRALTQTLAEKQMFIDEWDSKWGANGSLPFYHAPATLTQEEKDYILNSSYERLLTPYIDGTYAMPDIFIFDHGYNDAAYEISEEMSTIPVDDNDRHYYIGAMNKLFRMILNANPKAKILMIGHFENDERIRCNNAQEKLADLWGFPLCKLWEISGISGKTITVDGVEKTMKIVYCPDGTHPHSDTSGETNLILANKIANWIKTVY